MDQEGFLCFLEQAGQREHVVAGLIQQVERFEKHLAETKRKPLEDADQRDLSEYVAAIQACESGKAGTQVRGIALYFKYVGNLQLARAASSIREKEIARGRRAFRLADFRGISSETASRMKAIGIVDVKQILKAGRTSGMRSSIAKRTGIAPEAILELVKLADLSRLDGVKCVRARLYYDSGIDTPGKIARWDSEELRKMLCAFVDRTRFDGVPPTPKELRNTVAMAKRLPKVVEY